tara:strand:- start:126 stop:332 length:207 start_codon:yes stop_codon:yes gene_type:complete
MERTKKFTPEEFNTLPRNADGDIIDLYDAFIWFTPKQVNALTGDDYSRVDDYNEELRCEFAAIAAEFV